MTDWKKVIAILYQGILSVECGTEGEGERSIKHLRPHRPWAKALGDLPGPLHPR